MTSTSKEASAKAAKEAPRKESAGHLEVWKKLESPPKDALKEIRGGRLKGKTDINPQWRYEVMTSVFGPIGKGWRYEVKRRETFRLDSTGEVALFMEIDLWVRYPGDTEWTGPIHGTGGSMLVSSERGSHYLNDEAEKMATTDALSTAMKMLGVASVVYRGINDTKYSCGGNGEGSGGAPAVSRRASRSDRGGGQRVVPACPECGSSDAVIRSRFQEGGFVCWVKRDGCGAEWVGDGKEQVGSDPVDHDAQAARVPSEDDLVRRALDKLMESTKLSQIDEIEMGAARVLRGEALARVVAACADRAREIRNQEFV